MAGKISPEPLDQVQVDDFLNHHMLERPLLINPYYDSPEQFFAWEADDVLKEVKIIPHPMNNEAQAFCDNAIKFYGLNRIELRQLRYSFYLNFKVFKMVLADSGINQQTKNSVKQAIHEMKSQAAAFAGMVNYFDALPSLP